MKKVIFIALLLLSVVLINNAHAQVGTTASAGTFPLLNMVIGVPEMIIISLFSCMAITILIVIIKKVTQK